MSALTDRASLLRAYFRLVNADASDADATEHDLAATANEGSYHLLQMGAWDAQLYLITCGVGSRWAKTTSALTLTGTDPDRYASLPADLLRLESDRNRSGLRAATGITWGREIPFSRRLEHIGNYFYIRGNEAEGSAEGELRLYVTKGAALPSGTVADYLYRHATLADGTTVDFPEDQRDLIPAYAAYRGSLESWFAGGPEQAQKIERNLDFQKNQAWRNTRFSREPKRVPVHQLMGDRWY